MKTAWTLLVIAGALIVTTSVAFPEQPFNGLSVIALACACVAGGFIINQPNRKDNNVHRDA